MKVSTDRLLKKMARRSAQQQARLDQALLAVERLTGENKALREALAEEKNAHQQTKRERRLLKNDCQKLETDHAVLLKKISQSGELLQQCVHRMYGASSERRRHDEQGQQILEGVLDLIEDDSDLEEGVENLRTLQQENKQREENNKTKPSTTRKRKRKRPGNAGGNNGKPVGLEEIYETYNVPDDHPDLVNALDVVYIGKRDIWELAAGNMMPYIRNITCPVARITLPGGQVMQVTLAPPKVMPRAHCGDDMLTQLAIDKVADHLPAYRQEKRFARDDLTIPRNKICRWLMAFADGLTPVADAIFQENCANPIIGIDDSVHRWLNYDDGGCKNGRIWAVSTPTGIYYQFTKTREGKWITDLLDEFTGGIMADAYSGHTQLLNRPNIQALFCWAHVRRKFFEAADQERAKIMLDLIGQLYGIEQQLTGKTPSENRFKRPALAKPILTAIKRQLDAWEADKTILRKSGLGKAINYTLKLWDGLTIYCKSCHAPIDNNLTEQGMRPNAMHRKNSLFSASIRGAEAYATILTLIHSANMNKLNPREYLRSILTDLHFKRRRIQDLTPAAYARRRNSGKKMSS